MNETNSSYYPKLSRYERRLLSKGKKAKARKTIMRQAFEKV